MYSISIIHYWICKDNMDSILSRLGNESLEYYSNFASLKYEYIKETSRNISLITIKNIPNEINQKFNFNIPKVPLIDSVSLEILLTPNITKETLDTKHPLIPLLNLLSNTSIPTIIRYKIALIYYRCCVNHNLTLWKEI